MTKRMYKEITIKYPEHKVKDYKFINILAKLILHWEDMLPQQTIINENCLCVIYKLIRKFADIQYNRDSKLPTNSLELIDKRHLAFKELDEKLYIRFFIESKYDKNNFIDNIKLILDSIDTSYEFSIRNIPEIDLFDYYNSVFIWYNKYRVDDDYILINGYDIKPSIDTLLDKKEITNDPYITKEKIKDIQDFIDITTIKNIADTVTDYSYFYDLAKIELTKIRHSVIYATRYKECSCRYEFGIDVYDNVIKDVRDVLISKGYSISYPSSESDRLIEISWS